MSQAPEWITLLGNFGFPIAITVYLLVSFGKKLDDLQKAITQLGDVINETRKD